MAPAPSVWNPIANRSAARHRQLYTLNRMVANNLITTAQASAAYDTPIHIAAQSRPDLPTIAPEFRDLVTSELRQRYSDDVIFLSGLQVRTTLDRQLQRAVVSALHDVLPSADDPEAAVVAVDPRNGDLRALATKRHGGYQKDGFDLERMAFLSDETLLPLKRDGLDPVPGLGAVRRSEPVARLKAPFGLTAWLVTGYEENRAALANTKAFSNDFTNLIGNAGFTDDQNPGGLGFADPPAHTRLRRILTPEFTMRRLSRLAPRIDAIVAEQLDAMSRAREPVDLASMFALPIPSLTICELLGIPYEDRADFQRLSTARFDLFGGANASLGAVSESLSYLRDVVKKQREEPGDGLLGMIVAEHGDQVDDQELAGLADGLLTGGLETTASMLDLGALVLLRDKDSFRLVRDDDSATDGFVEELLRYLTVVQVAFPRFAREDVEIGGVKIAAGDIVVCSLSGANRDPALDKNSHDPTADGGMEAFDARRVPTSHLAFGFGAHRCIGAELGRMELRAAYPALLRRFPDLRLAVEPDELSFRKLSIVYGVESLPVLLR
jgi:cytochrome P450